MRIKVVYIFRSKQELADVLRQRGQADLFQLIGAPNAWTNQEPDRVKVDEEWMNGIKLAYLKYLLSEYDDLQEYLDPNSSCSVETFDRFWTVERVEWEGDLNAFAPRPYGP